MAQSVRDLEIACISKNISEDEESMEVDLPDLTVTDVVIITVPVSEYCCNDLLLPA